MKRPIIDEDISDEQLGDALLKLMRALGMSDEDILKWINEEDEKAETDV